MSLALRGPEKVAALQDTKATRNKEEMHRFLGFVNYLSKLVARMSELTAPLRALLKEEREREKEKIVLFKSKRKRKQWIDKVVFHTKKQK